MKKIFFQAFDPTQSKENCMYMQTLILIEQQYTCVLSFYDYSWWVEGHDKLL